MQNPVGLVVVGAEATEISIGLPPVGLCNVAQTRRILNTALNAMNSRVLVFRSGQLKIRDILWRYRD